MSTGMWPTPSPPEAFQLRRDRLARRLAHPVLLASGWPRPRNFAHNHYGFRAESHFLYLVGAVLPAAALLLREGRCSLYVSLPDPQDEVWLGPVPTPAQLEQTLGMEVVPLSELPRLPSNTTTLWPQDPTARDWLLQVLGRDTLEPSDGDGQLADAIIDQRLIHDEAAVAQMRQAIAATALAHRAGMRATRQATRESELVAVMLAELTRVGMATAYAPIVSVHGEVLHNSRHDGVLGPRDLVLADVGAETPEGWAADVTRTWPVRGFDAAQRELYQVVLDAQLHAIASVRPGVEFRDVHAATSQRLLQGLVDLGLFIPGVDLAELQSLGAADLFFPHGVGHLLGLDVHDMEDLGDRAGYASGRQRTATGNTRYLRLDRPLAAGMVVTIEPGFYQVPRLLQQARDTPVGRALDHSRLQSFAHVRGIRIEDDVLVTPDGHEVLSGDIPKTIVDLEQLLV